MEASDNYDEDFIDESLPKDGMEDLFNQNKNFSGGLAALTGNKGNLKVNDKESDPSGLGVDDNYEDFDF
jgi:hypothetical protein